MVKTRENSIRSTLVWNSCLRQHFTVNSKFYALPGVVHGRNCYQHVRCVLPTLFRSFSDGKNARKFDSNDQFSMVRISLSIFDKSFGKILVKFLLLVYKFRVNKNWTKLFPFLCWWIRETNHFHGTISWRREKIFELLRKKNISWYITLNIRKYCDFCTFRLKNSEPNLVLFRFSVKNSTRNHISFACAKFCTTI